MEKKTKKIEKKAKISEVSPAKVYNQEGKEVGEVKLSGSVFGLSWNADLVQQVVASMLSASRAIYAHTKDRSQVSGGGKKPWKQKGLGRARHGSTRSPIWVHGGVAHGPNGLKNYDRKINKKMKIKALYTILSKKFKDGEVIFVDKFEIAKPKTVDAISILKSLSKIDSCSDIFTKKRNSAIIAISGKKSAFEKSFANVGNVEVDEVRNINPVDLLNTKYIVIENPEESIKFIENKMANAK
ncbi:MAG: 50S ribosomal protein L4 [Candidatus Pacebacteria bacterium]|nr:50S ribosomal protein L4 [Candidatus Paceibacterota bacterium]